ncbi:MAG: TldD/PmbA family protein [Myxococcota bacterium]|nr:TldD/PmbA family protein [Myxococcota bacterium]
MTAPVNLSSVGQQVIALATELGAEEAAVGVTASVYSDLAQRDGKLEKCQESRSLSVGLELMVDSRFSTHSTNDLRPGALREFLTRAIDATRFLEPDENRRLADPTEMGRSDASLDVDDTTWAETTPTGRREQVATLEAACLSAGKDAPVRSINAFGYDGRVDSCMVTSNGFSERWQRTTIGYGGQVTLEDEGGRLPEAYAFYTARHRADLPGLNTIAAELIERGQRRLGSKPAASGRYPMLLDNRAVGQMMRVLTGPLSGTAVYEGRSCLRDKLGESIAASGFNLLDDPLIPRALGSRPFTGDGFASKQRHIIEDGTLRSFFVSLYNSRRLKCAPTAGASNLVIPAGTRSPAEMIASLPRVIRVDGFLGGNTNAITGDFSFGISGTLFEGGEPVAAVSEMNISGDLFTLLSQWQEAASDTWTWGSWRSPSLLFDGVQFSGT